jgi:nucleotide-binding universal stress UspA family protein
MDRIVVGVDGSDGAQSALEWAVDEARRRGAVVHVVAAWLQTPVVGFPDAVGLASISEEIEADTRATAEAAVAKATGEGVGVEILVDVRRDTAAHALLEASQAATMLVVGSRGLGGFRGLLLGSVSQQCAHHAACPVVIVPPAARQAGRS